MNPLLVFGGIFLTITLAVYPKLKKTVVNDWCPEEHQAVASNKKYFKLFVTIFSAMTLIGLILTLC